MMQSANYASYADLCESLVSEKGLLCDEVIEMERLLNRIGYRCFSGYARQFQRFPKYGDDNFEEGTTFNQIESIIKLDAELRSLLLKQLSVVEIAVRTALAREYGEKYGDGAFYLNPEIYKDGADPAIDVPTGIVSSILLDLESDKSEVVLQYRDSAVEGSDFESRRARYLNVPLWIAVDSISFGRVARMLNYFKDIDPAKNAAASLSITWSDFASVIHALSVLRNRCAHHRQLWNRPAIIECPVRKKRKPREVKFSKSSVYAPILMANHYRDRIDGDTSLANDIDKLIHSDNLFAKGILDPSPASLFDPSFE